MTSAPARPGLLHRLRRHSLPEIAAAAEALALVVLAAPAVRLLPFRTLGRLASGRIRRPVADPAARTLLINRVGWAVDVAGRRSPLRALCFEKGLAAQVMARRRGLDATLFYGARMSSAEKLDAHVWVICDGYDLQGGVNAGDYGVLARFPADGAGTKPAEAP